MQQKFSDFLANYMQVYVTNWLGIGKKIWII